MDYVSQPSRGGIQTALNALRIALKHPSSRIAKNTGKVPFKQFSGTTKVTMHPQTHAPQQKLRLSSLIMAKKFPNNNSQSAPMNALTQALFQSLFDDKSATKQWLIPEIDEKATATISEKLEEAHSVPTEELENPFRVKLFML